MRRKQDGAVLCQPTDQPPHLDDLRRIQADGRLIQDEQLGLVQDGLGQPHTLSIAFAQLADGAGQVVLQGRRAQRLREVPWLIGIRDLAQVSHHPQVPLN